MNLRKSRLKQVSVLLPLILVTAVNCSKNNKPTGKISLALMTPGGDTIENVDYEITGNGVNMSGNVPTPGDTTEATFLIGGIPVGTDYTLSITGTSVEGTVCVGSAQFDVEANQTTVVGITLECGLQNDEGNVVVNVDVVRCAQVDAFTASPVNPEGDTPVALSVMTTGSITWSSSDPNGTFGDPSAADTTYTCGDSGVATITLSVEGDGCSQTANFDVDCLPVGDCGNEIIEGREECDDGPDGSESCSDQCLIIECGNNRVDPGEECDDGPDGSESCDSECNALASACTVCEEQNCRNFLGRFDVIDGCLNAEGMAQDGPAAGTAKNELCTAIVDCAKNTGCSASAFETCYCGDASIVDCQQGVGVNGVCKAEIEAGAETTDAATIAARFVNPEFAVGAAAGWLRCDLANCADECLQGN